jgi:opacity protein-like surface antigen
MIRRVLFSVVIVGVTSTPMAFAESDESSGQLSAGISMGVADGKIKGVPGTDHEGYFGITGRYQLNNGILFDLGYFISGDHEAEDAFGTEVDVDALSGQIGYAYEFAENLQVYGRVGLVNYSLEVYQLRASGTSVSNVVVGERKVVDDKGTSGAYGLGVDYFVGDRASIGASYQYFDLDAHSIDYYGLNASLLF